MRFKFIFIVPVTLFFIFRATGFSNASVASKEGGVQFSITTTGRAEGRRSVHGTNEISVSEDGMMRVGIGDSSFDRGINGVGVYELMLNNEHAVAAHKLSGLLCSELDPESDVPIDDLYIAQCGSAKDGVRSGALRDFSRDIAVQIAKLVKSLKNAALRDGRAIVKLDASALSVSRARDGFVVSVKFSNGGDYPIVFETPDKWDGKDGRDILGVSGSGFGIALAGHPVVNAKEFPGGEVRIAPRSSIAIDIKSDDVDKFSSGTHELNVEVFMNIRVIGRTTNLRRVDFHSDYKNPARVTFDREYPSTPHEREQWEAKHRADMSFYPVKPGAPFAEDGLYRAERLISGGTYRSLQVMPFKAGDVATTDSVKMPMESGNGVNINGPVQWIWEGSAPQPVKPFATEYVEGTQHHCAPGASCPRSGRWVARGRSGWNSLYPDYRYDLSNIVTLQRGQTMPSVQNEASKAEWEWVGA